MTPAIDVRTLYLATAVVAGFFGVVFIAFHAIDATTRGILQWGIAYLLVGVGLTFNLFREVLHPVFYSALASFCFVLAAVLLDIGIRSTGLRKLAEELTDGHRPDRPAAPASGPLRGGSPGLIAHGGPAQPAVWERDRGLPADEKERTAATFRALDIILPLLTLVLLLVFLLPVPHPRARMEVLFLALAWASSRSAGRLISQAREAGSGLRTALMTFAVFYTLVAVTFVTLAVLTLLVGPIRDLVYIHPMHGVLLPGLMLFLIGAGMSKLWVHYMRAYAEARRAATVDPLTGVRNRRFVMPELERMFQRAQREERRLACLMLDADAFKSVNDSYGHRTGDRVLQTLARRITKTVRDYDLVGRYGGEEFLVVVPELAEEDVVKMAHRLHEAIRSRPIAQIRVTVSVGVAFVREDDRRADDLLQRADRALYRAKNAGRDQIVVAGGPDDGSGGPA